MTGRRGGKTLKRLRTWCPEEPVKAAGRSTARQRASGWPGHRHERRIKVLGFPIWDDGRCTWRPKNGEISPPERALVKLLRAAADRIREARRTSKMVNTIASVPHVDPTAASQAATKSTASSQKAAPSQSKATTGGAADTVQISTAAQIAQAALKEATETPAQTATEAQGGDHQAQRLLAKESAPK
jgi:hypothetical protein